MIQTGILVVDDDQNVRTFLTTALRQLGYAVWAAGGGAQAVALYAEHRDGISLVLLDVLMAGMDGPATLRALRKVDPSVRCCFITGEAGGHDLLALGAERVLRKPFSIAELAGALWEVVALPQ